jgi:DNA-binding NtrC family response regulator
LRDRPEDIPELIEHFLTTRQLGPTRYQIQPNAREALVRHDWPGNVRELANVLERAQILAEEHCITLDDLPESLVTTRTLPSAGAESDDPRRLDSVERRHVLTVLQQEKGNKVHAARALGISRRALYRLLEKYQLPS